MAACALHRASITREEATHLDASVAFARSDIVYGAVAIVVDGVAEFRGRDDRIDAHSPCFSIGVASLFSGATSPLAGE